MSRVGRRPVEIPKGVKVTLDKNKISIEGPNGKLSFEIHSRISVEVKENNVMVARSSDSKIDKSLHGTTRAIINNMIKGVTEGYSKQLEIQGVGYRAQVAGKNLTMNLGFSHQVEYPIPEGITIETPKPNIIMVKGIDKAKVGEVAAEIRDFYRPEPYKGKGIYLVFGKITEEAGFPGMTVEKMAKLPYKPDPRY